MGESTILALDDVYSPVAALLETGRNDDARSEEVWHVGIMRTCLE